jgi:hypothetical protein
LGPDVLHTIWFSDSYNLNEIWGSQVGDFGMQCCVVKWRVKNVLKETVESILYPED